MGIRSSPSSSSLDCFLSFSLIGTSVFSTFVFGLCSHSCCVAFVLLYCAPRIPLPRTSCYSCTLCLSPLKFYNTSSFVLLLPSSLASLNSSTLLLARGFPSPRPRSHHGSTNSPVSAFIALLAGSSSVGYSYHCPLGFSFPFGFTYGYYQLPCHRCVEHLYLPRCRKC